MSDKKQVPLSSREWQWSLTQHIGLLLTTVTKHIGLLQSCGYMTVRPPLWLIQNKNVRLCSPKPYNDRGTIDACQIIHCHKNNKIHPKYHRESMSSQQSSILLYSSISLRCERSQTRISLSGVTAAVQLSNKAWGGVVYGQYSTAKGCSYARCNEECLDTALSRDILAIYHKPTRYLIASINCLPT